MEEPCRVGGPNRSMRAQASQVLSCSPRAGPGLLSSLPFPLSSDHGIPTSVAFTSTEPAHIVASFRSGDTVLYDLEAGSALLSLESRGSSGKRGPSAQGWCLSARRASVPPVALVTRHPVSRGWFPYLLQGIWVGRRKAPAATTVASTGLSGRPREERSSGTYLSGVLEEWVACVGGCSLSFATPGRAWCASCR